MSQNYLANFRKWLGNWASIQEFSEISIEAKILQNGKYQGIVIHRLIGRFSKDDLASYRVSICDSMEEALRDAEKFARTRDRS